MAPRGRRKKSWRRGGEVEVEAEAGASRGLYLVI